jgi:hypothetical protein
VDITLKNELDLIYPEIVDEKIAAFIKEFIELLKELIAVKAKYGKKNEELIVINSPSGKTAEVKKKFQSKKSISFKQKRALTFKVKYKEDEVYPEQASKFESTMPIIEEQALLSSGKKEEIRKGSSSGSMDISTPKIEQEAKQKLKIPGKLSHFGFGNTSELNSPNLSPTTAKTQVLKHFLQKNSNHLIQLSNSSPKKLENLKDIKQKIKEATTNHNTDEIENSLKNHNKNPNGSPFLLKMRKTLAHQFAPKQSTSANARTDKLTGLTSDATPAFSARKITKAKSIEVVKTFAIDEEPEDPPFFPSLVDK